MHGRILSSLLSLPSTRADTSHQALVTDAGPDGPIRFERLPNSQGAFCGMRD